MKDKNKDAEQVLVATRRTIAQVGMFQGIKLEPDKYMEAFSKPGGTFFVPREEAEANDKLKQIIPYCIMCCGDHYVSYVRSFKGGEKRLTDKRSIGIGGHINPVDCQTLFQENPEFQDTYDNAVQREFEEEIKSTGLLNQSVVGLLNDDSTEVGKVHFGIIHFIDLQSREVTSREDALADLQMMTLNDMLGNYAEYEDWSIHCLHSLQELTHNHRRQL